MTSKPIDEAAAQSAETSKAGDVRGLPAGWTVEVDGEHVKVTKPDGAVSEWHKRPATNGSGMYDLCQALAAEGVQCETCNGASVIVTYVDPYERGDVSSPEQSPCPDCAEGVQAGEVEQRAREMLRHQYIKRGYSDGGATVRVDSIERYEPAAFSAIVAALSQQPEARGVVDGWKLIIHTSERDNEPGVWAEKDGSRIWIAALTGERNG